MLSRILVLLLMATPALAQDDVMDHAAHMNMGSGDSLSWRMPPMDMSMPMLPSLMRNVPIVGPLLPGHGMDPSMFPEAKPSTIINMADGDTLHRVQQAFIDHGGAQCGICTPGMVLAAVQLLDQNPDPGEPEIREALAGNLCRCTGYMRIFKSVLEAVPSGPKAKPGGLQR